MKRLTLAALAAALEFASCIARAQAPQPAPAAPAPVARAADVASIPSLPPCTT